MLNRSHNTSGFPQKSLVRLIIFFLATEQLLTRLQYLSASDLQYFFCTCAEITPTCTWVTVSNKGLGRTQFLSDAVSAHSVHPPKTAV